MRRILLIALVVVRWWFGLSYVIAGPIGIVWGPVVLVQGDAGGIYLFIGGLVISGAGWAIHPWGFERGMQPDAASIAPRAWLPRWMLRRPA